ncbi:hypothetical protein J4416_03080 [Candidatus Pacearchaeota archaeon]|nr:hypothetical protein [Candidatus Pacearchaeota archaeon]
MVGLTNSMIQQAIRANGRKRRVNLLNRMVGENVRIIDGDKVLNGTLQRNDKFPERMGFYVGDSQISLANVRKVYVDSKLIDLDYSRGEAK